MSDNPVVAANLMVLTRTVEAVRVKVDALVQGLTLMLKTQALQGEMMQKLHEAIQPQQEDEGKVSHLEAVLTGLAAAVRDQTVEVVRFRSGLAAAVLRGARLDQEPGEC